MKDRDTVEGVVVSTNFTDSGRRVFGEMTIGLDVHKDSRTIHFEALGEAVYQFDGLIGRRVIVSGTARSRFDRPLSKGKVGWRKVLEDARLERVF